MDIYGKEPSNQTGEYFRNTVWWWPDLWKYCCVVAPDLCGQVENAYTNDGDGLDEEDSVALARLLREEINSGRTAAYEVTRQATLDALPDEECWWCKGTGARTLEPGTVAVAQPCSHCEATGKCRPSIAEDRFEVVNVEEFAAFLASSGGFEIW